MSKTLIRADVCCYSQSPEFSSQLQASHEATRTFANKKKIENFFFFFGQLYSRQKSTARY